MTTAALHNEIGAGAVWRSHVGIPVRNLWMLLVYAAGLAEFLDRFDAEIDEAAELPDLLARFLIITVERRLRRSLSRSYRPKSKLLARVRGRIDWLGTETGLNLQRGRIMCRFEELTHDTPRNRLVRAALEAMQGLVGNRELATACSRLARELMQMGVLSGRPSRTEMSRDQIGRHDADDRLMVAVATLALDTVLPSEASGDAHLTRLDRDERRLRLIFEKAVAGLYRHELHGREGWRVRQQASLTWQAELPTPGLMTLLPSMAADLILDRGSSSRMVLDTKFTSIITNGAFGSEGLKSAHIYQLYAYLRSQAGKEDALADTAGGILLHPSLDRHVDEAVTIQGHRLRFVTVDLSMNSSDIRTALLNIAKEPSSFAP